MSRADATSGLAVYQCAVEAAGIAIALGVKSPALLKPIADQLIRSAASAPANRAEGHGRTGRDRARLWRIAYGSAKKADCHLRLLASAGAIDRARADDAIQSCDRVRAVLWVLLHPGR